MRDEPAQPDRVDGYAVDPAATHHPFDVWDYCTRGFRTVRGDYTVHVGTSADDTPVYAIELRPEDGLYPLPYMGMQADGSPWQEEMAVPLGPSSSSQRSS